jgi:3-oxoacyl-[acyl-carrier protein] reductase
VDLGIRGRTALVTASSGGMGLSLAHTLASEGANIVLLARGAGRLEAAAADVEREHGVVVHAVAGSMRDPEAASRLATVLEPLRGPDILVLVTGRPPSPLRDTVAETDLARWRAAYENQLEGAINVVNGVLPLMRSLQNGRIVAITSAHAKSPVPGHALSSVFRAGVTAYLKSLSTEVAPDGITVNCVAPALIDTSHRTGQAAYTAAQTEHRRTLTPLGRMGTQEELAAVVAFLCSRQAGFLTGATVTVDGGMSTSLF